MAEITFETQKGNIFSNVLRVIFGGLGLLYCIAGITELYPEWNLEMWPLFNVLLGLAILFTAIINPRFGKRVTVELNDEYLRTTEDTVLTRSAYWGKIDRLIIKQFKIIVQYRTGTEEPFRLPYLDNEDFEKLKSFILKQSTSHNFEVEDDAGWKFLS